MTSQNNSTWWFDCNQGKQERPKFEKPNIIGYFSLNMQGGKRDYVGDYSQLVYLSKCMLRKRKVHLNLNNGLDKAIRKPVGKDERIDFILTWILSNYNKITLDPQPEPSRWLKPEFICYRGTLTKIATSNYDDSLAWILCAVKFHGTIYICAYDTEEQKHEQLNQTPNDLKFTSYGFKFEQYMTADHPKSMPRTYEPVNEGSEFSCVYTTKLNDMQLLYPAEMDAVDSDVLLEEPIDWNKINFVEFKTSKELNRNTNLEYWYRKVIRWWCQSYLVGVRDLFCGNRSHKGIVYRVDKKSVQSLEHDLREYNWYVEDCLKFCEQFLNHLKTVVKQDHDKCIYKFYKPTNRRQVELEILPGDSELAFLPDWFTDPVNKIVTSRDNSF
ncbi:hypothetical protein TKK_0018107 [Trichogramma kaykai]|uniref:Decapping nuclease n=1 Tax=Trichogramma kaykai TaxID=54128 RepID=A0ABD2VZV6_9HYME